MTYKIMGQSRYGKEELDETDSLQDAECLVKEYRLAFGQGWSIWIAKSFKSQEEQA